MISVRKPAITTYCAFPTKEQLRPKDKENHNVPVDAPNKGMQTDMYSVEE